MDPAPGLAVRQSHRYALSAELGATYCAVEAIRLRADEIEVAVAQVDTFMAETGTRIASWWVTERSTPDDVEDLFDQAFRTIRIGLVGKAAAFRQRLTAAVFATQESSRDRTPWQQANPERLGHGHQLALDAATIFKHFPVALLTNC